VAEFRADYSRRPRDPAIRGLVEELSEGSPPFRSLWNKQEVLRREGGERGFHHPVDGDVEFLQTTLLVASHPECKLVCLVPLGTNPKKTKRPARSRARGSRSRKASQ
jgi:hypothetical protein